MSDLERFQTQYLFLLVGTNPLPNYVAVLLLAQDEGTVYLLHSGGTHGTGDVAARLKQAIKNRRPSVRHVIPYEVDEADGPSIVRKVSEIIEGLPADVSVGLHYSGGTKPMAIHVYRAIERRFPKGVFSYLDARTLSLVIDDQGGARTKRIPVWQDCVVTLGELVTLHGYEKPSLRQQPFQPALCQALAQVHSTPQSFRQWREWCENEKFLSLPDTGKYPLLQNVRQAFDKMCGGTATPTLVAQRLGYAKLTQCSKWLTGEWLEEYTLKAISQVADRCGIGQNYSIDLKLRRPGGHEFQLDVAAVRGYQLFGISCMASDRKEKCKEHLLEIYVRSRQMGGDEAKVGLVCCYHDPDALEGEIEETWFTQGRVRVFGMKDLPNLPERLAAWFQTASDR